jgi:hypothetical protein
MDAVPIGVSTGRSSGAGARDRRRVERKLLQMAVAALTAGRKEEARSYLEQHRRQFPGGALVRVREELLAAIDQQPAGTGEEHTATPSPSGDRRPR